MAEGADSELGSKTTNFSSDSSELGEMWSLYVKKFSKCYVCIPILLSVLAWSKTPARF